MQLKVFLCKFDLLTDLLGLMCYQNYRFPVKLLLGSQLCVWLQVRAIPAWGETWEQEGKSQSSGISGHKSHNPISLWSQLIQWMDGTEQGPVIHCTHFLCQYVPLTPTHHYHEDISLSPPVLMVLIQGILVLCHAHVDIGIRHIQASQST